MNLKNRNQSLRMKGEDVELLQKSLRLLNFTIEDKDGYFGKTTRQAVLEFQKTHNLEPTGIVDKRTAAIIRKEVTDIQLELDEDPRKRCCVQGNLLQPDGIPVEGAAIKAFDKDLRREKLLGETKTDKNGKYVIHYTIDQLCHLDKSSTDLIVRAYNQKGKEIATSPLILNAPPEKVVDLVVGNEVYRGPSEYIKIRTQVEPLLQDTNVTELTEEDVTYLAGKTGLDPIHIAYFAQSALLAQKTDIPAEVFYGLFRLNLPTNLPTLLAQDRKVLRRALETATSQNIISPKLQESIDEILKQFQGQIIENAFKKPEIPFQSSFSEFLGVANLSKEKQEKFLQKYVQHEGHNKDFWQNLRNDPEFGSETVETIQSTLQLATLTQDHLPLVKALREKQKTGKFTSLRDLARLNHKDWVNLINQEIDDKLVGIPPRILGKDEKEKTENYIRVMMRMVEDAFPTAVIAHCIDDDFPHAEALKKFFEKNPDFEFRTMKIDSYLAKNENALANTKEAEEVKEQLKGMQRLFDITPRYNKYDFIKGLTDKKLTSAYAIRQMGKTAFTETYKQHFGHEMAQQIYAGASQKVAKTQELIIEYMSDNRDRLYVIQDTQESLEGIPEWRSLFGSLDLCECEHCRSVYSPAAYLVDVLYFLKNIENEKNESALKVLFKRRGDIGGIELTCKNTNTVMPYVDLVNEILENAVLENKTDENENSENTVKSKEVYQTKWTAEELRVCPENINYGAYEYLAEAIYPWTLPFDLPAEEARMYLAHLGVPRYELMERFRKEKAEYDIASEYLHLTPREWKIITATTSEEPCECWDMSGDDWASELRFVSKFLEKSGLSYKELQELLQLHFINPNGEMYVEFSKPNCNLDGAKIVYPSEDVNLLEETLARIHRFVRLQRRLNWSVRELDAALRALPPKDLTSFLINLSYVQRLRDTLKVPLISMLSWWSNIDTASYDDEPSLYEKLFLNKTVMNPPDAAFELDEKTECNEKICDHIPTILSALRISEDDLALIIKEELLRDELTSENSSTLYRGVVGSDTSVEDVEKLVKELLSNVKLTLDNLSALYRTVSLAKALKLSLRDFLSLRILSGINPFDAQDIAATIRFVEMAELVRASGFSIAELDYLLRHQYQPNSAVAPSEKEISLILGELRNDLQKIAQEYQFASDPTGEKTAQALAILLSEEKVKKAMVVLDDSSTMSVENPGEVINYFDDFLDIEETEKNLIGSYALSGEGRFNYVLKPLLIHLRQIMSETLVKQKLADALDLPVETIEQLLTKLVNSRDDVTKKAINDFLDQDFIKIEEEVEEEPLTAESFPDQFNQFILLHKIATIITRFDIPSEELTWLFQNERPDLGWLDLNKLPLTEIDSGEELFKKWFEMAKMAYLRDGLPPGEPTLFALLKIIYDETTTDKFITALCDRTGWHKEDLEFLMGPKGFNLKFPDDFQNEKALKQLIRFKSCFEIIKIVGVSAETIWSWNTSCIEFEQTQSIRQAVRAKYEEEQWLTVAKPLRDELRERQRAALVAYCVHELGKNFGEIKDVDDLFGHFLIDVEMSSCMMTSRIKQAISSVQLFVNRCLMNLEPEVELTPKHAKEWEWMKNYRVWEANRKVFLYPANWIEPELRDNKSPFFVDLENELLQDEVTMDTAERAFLNYLEKLDEVARLEICGMYYQTEDNIIRLGNQIEFGAMLPEREFSIPRHFFGRREGTILHVFGRTRGTPHIYYYRQWVDGAYWTPWERVDVDVEGDHLIPYIYNRRLHLFWPIFREKVDEENVDLTKKDPPDKPKKYYEIQMAWSEYRNGKWLAKRISNEFIDTKDLDAQYPRKELFRFWAFLDKVKSLVIAPERRGLYGEVKEILDQFKFTSCKGNIETKKYFECDETRGLYPVRNTYSVFMKFVDVSYWASSRENTSDFPFQIIWAPGIWATVFQKTPSTFSVVVPHQYRPFGSFYPFFYEDNERTFFVVPGVELVPREELVETIGVVL